MDDRRGAFEWGLTSVLVGGVMSICAFQSDSGPPIHDVTFLGFNIPYAALALPALMQFVTFFGIACGGRAVLLARKARRPIALGLAGLVLGIVAVLFWSFICQKWYIILTSSPAPAPMYIQRSINESYPDLLNMNDPFNMNDP